MVKNARSSRGKSLAWSGVRYRLNGQRTSKRPSLGMFNAWEKIVCTSALRMTLDGDVSRLPMKRHGCLSRRCDHVN